MICMTKFIDANIFVRRFNDPKVMEFTNRLNREEHCTSILVLAETYHKLKKNNVENVFSFFRTIMGAVEILDVTQSDFFLALTSNLEINVNDKIHIATMKRNNIL